MTVTNFLRAQAKLLREMDRLLDSGRTDEAAQKVLEILDLELSAE